METEGDKKDDKKDLQNKLRQAYTRLLALTETGELKHAGKSGDPRLDSGPSEDPENPLASF